jgi:hypothetical protein
MELIFVGSWGLYSFMIWWSELAVTALAKNEQHYNAFKSLILAFLIGNLLALMTCLIIDGAMRLARVG